MRFSPACLATSGEVLAREYGNPRFAPADQHVHWWDENYLPLAGLLSSDVALRESNQCTVQESNLQPAD